MKNRARAAALLLVTASALLPSIAVAGPAHADRCEPEEIVLGPNTSPIDERDSPACTAFFFYIYPFICSPDGVPPSSLAGPDGCTQNLSLNPAYVPPLIPPYNPDFGRATCNLILFVNPNGTCLFTADPATGDINVTSTAGSVTIPTIGTLEATS